MSKCNQETREKIPSKNKLTDSENDSIWGLGLVAALRTVVAKGLSEECQPSNWKFKVAGLHIPRTRVKFHPSNALRWIPRRREAIFKRDTLVFSRIVRLVIRWTSERSRRWLLFLSCPLVRDFLILAVDWSRAISRSLGTWWIFRDAFSVTIRSPSLPRPSPTFSITFVAEQPRQPCNFCVRVCLASRCETFVPRKNLYSSRISYTTTLIRLWLSFLFQSG